MLRLTLLVSLLCLLTACEADRDPISYDLIIEGGTLYDGSGDAGRVTDIAVTGDRIDAIGDLSDAEADQRLDASGKIVSPGFINMLSWAVETLIVDGRGMSDLKQGVTLEVFGEGVSMGPLTEAMKQERLNNWRYGEHPIEWTTLGDYLEYLEARGVSPNIASFVGATTLRIHEVGYDDRRATDAELARMKALTAQAMEEGALGLGSSLIYAPANFADTDELAALMGTVADYGGMYISHLRSESNGFIEALDELIEISRRSGAPAEVYHLKAAGRTNWDKLDQAIARIEAARVEGLQITADAYLYPASATGLNAAMPLWVQEGGPEQWRARLRDPDIRARVIAEMRNPPPTYESRIPQAGGGDGVLLINFRNPDLRKYVGWTLAQVADERGVSVEDAAIDLVIEDDSRVDVVYFLMSEENVAKKSALPWVSFGSDAGAPAPNEPFTQGGAHPRTYGNFARLLGKYVRDEGVVDMADAIRRLTSFPAENLKLRDRGRLDEGYFADIVVFDPATIADRATFADAHQLAVGVEHVFVNGVHTIRAGEHTGAKAGRVVRGPGWAGWRETSEGS